jgi:hypothetical protein
MASSYLDYCGETLRLNDGLFEIVFKLLIQQGKRIYKENPTFSESFDDWDNRLRIAGPGLIDIPLGGNWESEEGHRVLLSLICDVERTVLTFGDSVPATFLDELVGFHSIVHIDVETDTLLRTIREIKDLFSKSFPR